MTHGFNEYERRCDGKDGKHILVNRGYKNLIVEKETNKAVEEFTDTYTNAIIYFTKKYF